MRSFQFHSAAPMISERQQRSARALMRAYSIPVGTATVCAFTVIYLLRRYAMGRVCKSRALLNGRTVIITGANSGIGKETALDLAKRNARVILACRSTNRGQKAADEIRNRSKNSNVVFQHLDLTSFASVRKFAAQVLNEEKPIDILINNAGVFMLPLRRTEDGIEEHFAVNFLSHLLLTNLLLIATFKGSTQCSYCKRCC